MTRTAPWRCLAAMTLIGLIQTKYTWPGCPQNNWYEFSPTSPGTFQHEADFHNCNIKSIENVSFPAELQLLRLLGNEITTIPPQAFRSNIHLLVLDLRNNRFFGRDLSPTLLQRCTRLQTIFLSGNNLANMPREIFKGLHLGELYMSEGSIKSMPECITSMQHPSLITLSLHTNLISRLDHPDTFSTVPNLEHLRLEHNRIVSMNEYLFESLPRLRHVDISDNKLKYVPRRLFQYKPLLKTLLLKNNAIEYVPEHAFRGTSLQYLDISQNRLTFLPENFFNSPGIERLRTFDFTSNPWQCACLNYVLMNVKRLKIGYFSNGYDGVKPMCVMTGLKCSRDEYRQSYDGFV